MSRYSEVLITHNDETKTLVDWAIFYRLDYTVLLARYKRGKRGSQLFSTARKYNYKRADEWRLPKSMSREDALLCALDDYYRNEVIAFSEIYQVTPMQLVTQTLDRTFKLLNKHKPNHAPNPAPDPLT